jgi:hypothetical protein
VRVDSSPDNDETGQYCQMVWARLARRRGVREEPAAESPSNYPPAPTWRIWAGQQRAPDRRAGSGTPGSENVVGSGGRGEGLRHSRGDAAGA